MCQVFGVLNAKIDVTHSWRQHVCHNWTKFPKQRLKKRSIVSSVRNRFCNSVSCFRCKKEKPGQILFAWERLGSSTQVKLMESYSQSPGYAFRKPIAQNAYSIPVSETGASPH